MFLLVTLSICFAANRHNHFDDLIFLLALLVNPYSVIILMLVILSAWAIWMRARAGGDPFPPGRPIPDGRVRGDSSGSREVVLTELLKSISPIVSEQCPWRRARVEEQKYTQCSRGSNPAVRGNSSSKEGRAEECERGGGRGSLGSPSSEQIQPAATTEVARHPSYGRLEAAGLPDTHPTAGSKRQGRTREASSVES